ncbi:sulfotransferase family 2 domain-containing protein [Vibrio astriarenae]
MPLIKSNESEWIYYIHIPKTGGTSLDVAIEKHYDLNFKSNSDLFSIPLHHLEMDMMVELGINKLFQRSFAVVRHPIDRILSEYKYRCKLNRLTRWILDFDGFVLLSLKEFSENKRILVNHIRPQVDFIDENTKVFKLEDGMARVLDYLREEGFSKLDEIPHLNKTNSERAKVSLSNCNLVKLYEFYHQDFERLSYKKYASKSITVSRLKKSSIIRMYIYILLRFCAKQYRRLTA